MLHMHDAGRGLSSDPNQLGTKPQEESEDWKAYLHQLNSRTVDNHRLANLMGEQHGHR